MSGSKIKVLHNIIIQPATSMVEKSNLHRDLFGERERVFSDRQEENSYLLKLYSGLPGITATLDRGKLKIRTEKSREDSATGNSLKCDEGSQCNLLDHPQLPEIVKVCAELNVDQHKDYSKLIIICRDFLNPAKENVQTVEGGSQQLISEPLDDSRSNFKPSRYSVAPDSLLADQNEQNSLLPSKSNEMQIDSTSKRKQRERSLVSLSSNSKTKRKSGSLETNESKRSDKENLSKSEQLTKDTNKKKLNNSVASNLSLENQNEQNNLVPSKSVETVEIVKTSKRKQKETSLVSLSSDSETKNKQTVNDRKGSNFKTNKNKSIDKENLSKSEQLTKDTDKKKLKNYVAPDLLLENQNEENNLEPSKSVETAQIIKTSKRKQMETSSISLNSDSETKNKRAVNKKKSGNLKTNEIKRSDKENLSNEQLTTDATSEKKRLKKSITPDLLFENQNEENNLVPSKLVETSQIIRTLKRKEMETSLVSLSSDSETKNETVNDRKAGNFKTNKSTDKKNLSKSKQLTKDATSDNKKPNLRIRKTQLDRDKPLNKKQDDDTVRRSTRKTRQISVYEESPFKIPARVKKIAKQKNHIRKNNVINHARTSRLTCSTSDEAVSKDEDITEHCDFPKHSTPKRFSRPLSNSFFRNTYGCQQDYESRYENQSQNKRFLTLQNQRRQLYSPSHFLDLVEKEREQQLKTVGEDEFL